MLSASERAEAFDRELRLHSRAWRMIEDAGYEPGQIHDIPDGEGYRIAFGYRTRVAGGIRQRYLEIPVTAVEHRLLDEASQQRILDALQKRLDALRAADPAS